MTERIEQIKKLIMSMTDAEMMELNRWIYECFKASDEKISWDEAIEEVGFRLKGLNSKPN